MISKDEQINFKQRKNVRELEWFINMNSGLLTYDENKIKRKELGSL